MTRRRLGGWARVLILIGLEAGAIFALHRLAQMTVFQIDWSHLRIWLSNNSLDNLIAASVRIAALGLAYYLLVTTTLYALVTGLNFHQGMLALRFVTLPSVRHSLEKALAVTVITSGLVGGSAAFALADSSPYPQPLVTTSPTDQTSDTSPDQIPPDIQKLFPGFPGGATPDSTPTTAAPAPATTTTTAVKQSPIPGLPSQTTTTSTPQNSPVPGVPQTPTSTPTSTPTPALPTPSPTPAPQVQGEQTYKVVEGDNLWSISKQHLASTKSVDPKTLSDRDVAQYWLTVIDANKANLRSGDPDLIYPGEAITLPAVN